MLSSWSRVVLDRVYPRRCIVTHELLTSNSQYRYLSSEAVESLRFIQAPHCSQCGYPFEGDVLANKPCVQCLELKPEFDFGRTVLRYQGAVRDVIQAFKYEGAFYLIPDMVKLFHQAPHLEVYLQDSVLVPVPLHYTKQRRRGYNQSLILAEALAKHFPQVTLDPVLKRIKKTQTQTHLTRQQRLKNVQNAFALRRQSSIIHNKEYILIDDVYTTGATLNACATALKDAGAASVKILTLAHG